MAENITRKAAQDAPPAPREQEENVVTVNGKPLKGWNIEQACGPDSPFEYDQGDWVLVPYDDLYDLVHPRYEHVCAQPSPAHEALIARIEKLQRIRSQGFSVRCVEFPKYICREQHAEAAWCHGCRVEADVDDLLRDILTALKGAQ